MTRVQGQNQLQIKGNNITSVKWLLVRNAPISRAEIAGALGLTPATVTNIVSELLAQGVVREIQEESVKSRGVGRSPIALEINPEAYYAIGISLMWEQMQICLTDLKGRIIAAEKNLEIPGSYSGVLDLITGHVEKMRVRAGKVPILGVGVAIPGMVSAREGKLLHARDREEWIGKPISKDLSDRTGLPVRIDNHGRARAMRIALFTPEVVDGSDSFLVCYVHEGISCHMQLMSRFLQGEGNAAGEIGYMIMHPDKEPLTSDQTLNEIAGLRAIRQQLRQRLIQTDQPSLLRTLCPEAESIPVQLILLAQEGKDPLVCEVLNRAMKYIGIALTNIVDFVNPSHIVLTGPLFRNSENVDMIREIIMKNAYSADSSNLKLVYQDPGEYGPALCGAALAVHRFFLKSSVV